MRKGTTALFAVSMAAALALLFVWHSHGFEEVDAVLDPLLALLVAVTLLALGFAVNRAEKQRRARMRRFYIGDGSVFNFEYGEMAGLPMEAPAVIVETIREKLPDMRYPLSKEEFPDDAEFACRVDTDYLDDEGHWEGVVVLPNGVEEQFHSQDELSNLIGVALGRN